MPEFCSAATLSEVSQSAATKRRISEWKANKYLTKIVRNTRITRTGMSVRSVNVFAIVSNLDQITNQRNTFVFEG